MKKKIIEILLLVCLILVLLTACGETKPEVADGSQPETSQVAEKQKDNTDSKELNKDTSEKTDQEKGPAKALTSSPTNFKTTSSDTFEQSNNTVTPAYDENSAPTSSKNTNPPVPSTPITPEKPHAHTHTWVAKTHEEPVYETVHHDAQTHEEPIYETHYYSAIMGHNTYIVCNRCGYRDLVYNGYTGEIFQKSNHIWDAHGGANTHTEEEPIILGYEEVTINDVMVNGYEEQIIVGYNTIVDKEAYDEKIQTGAKTITDYYYCSKCGEKK